MATGTATGTGNYLTGCNIALVCTANVGHVYRDYSEPSYPEQYTEYIWFPGASSTITIPLHVRQVILRGHGSAKFTFTGTFS